ncbi:hypothetical protein, partial [Telmatospirillum sp.]|uniref:hypothetical protein n=1 Tax=Telmatospirillum sp. TaxID=2079197 RepID=UPI002846C1E5
MANIYAYSGYYTGRLTNDFGFGIMFLDSLSSTQFVEKNAGIFQDKMVFSGNFTVTNNNLAGGTITGLEILDSSGNEIVDITDVNIAISSTGSFNTGGFLSSGSTYYDEGSGNYLSGTGNDTYVAHDGSSIVPRGGTNTIQANGTGINVYFSGGFSSYSLAAASGGGIWVMDSNVYRNGNDDISGSAILTFRGDSSRIIDNSGVLTLVSTASTAENYGNSALISSIDVSDSAANVNANLSGLESRIWSGQTMDVTLTDGGTPTLMVTPTQLADNAGVLAAISSSYSLAVTGTVSAAVAATASLWPTVVEKLTSALTVADLTANVQSNLDGLQSIAAAGKLSSITLVNYGTPTLTVTAAQAGQDAGALHAIFGSYTLDVTGTTATIGAFLAKEDVNGRGLGGIAAEYSGIAPSG